MVGLRRVNAARQELITVLASPAMLWVSRDPGRCSG